MTVSVCTTDNVQDLITRHKKSHRLNKNRVPVWPNLSLNQKTPEHIQQTVCYL